MNIIGISAFYHDAACCLLRDGKLVAAASEERFTRVKHDPRLPVHAFRFCLAQAGLGIGDIDCLAFYEQPEIKLERQLWSRLESRDDVLPWIDPGQAERAIRERIGYDGPIEFFPHHLSHAASAYFFSGFDQAAILIADGVGEWATTSYGLGKDDKLSFFEEVAFPHSLGLLYATITAYLGFRVNNGEYKVMGLAPYGRPKYVDQLQRLIETLPGGQYRLNLKYFDFIRGERMYSQALCDLLGRPPRQPESTIGPFHRDVARSLQVLLEDTLLGKVRWLAERTAAANLCMAGGVALNCVANGRILREGPFERLFVQPAAGDAGGCLGAAALAHHGLSNRGLPREHIDHAFLGPRYKDDQVAELIAASGIEARHFAEDETALIEAVAERLAANQIVGWFQGPMEFGPRALGARSILANPMDPTARDRLNGMIKKRESFRPFAPSVLESEASAHFALDHASPFMLETCQVASKLALPAVTHVDGSARPQTVTPRQHPRFAALLRAFQRRTGCPILVNTSFNMRGEPIVQSPVDALFCMDAAGLDALAIESWLIDRQDLPAHWSALLPHWRRRASSAFGGRRSAIRENLYSFV